MRRLPIPSCTANEALMRASLRDPVLQAELVAEGSVAVPVLDAEAVAALLADLQSLRPADGFAPTARDGLLNHHVTLLDRDVDYRRATHAMLVRHFQPAIDRLLDRHRVVASNFHVKQPGDGSFPSHQNWPVLPLDQTSVTIWCALVDADEENGTLHVVPRSHKLLPHVEGPAVRSYFDSFRPQIARYMKPLPARAGHGHVFDDSVIHGSPANRSQRSRIAVQVICVPEEAQPIFFHPCGERFEIIAAESDFYVEQSARELTERRPGWRSLGFVENRNRPIDEAEFRQCLGLPPDPAAAPAHEAAPAAPSAPPTLGERLRATAARWAQALRG